MRWWRGEAQDIFACEHALSLPALWRCSCLPFSLMHPRLADEVRGDVAGVLVAARLEGAVAARVAGRRAAGRVVERRMAGHTGRSSNPLLIKMAKISRIPILPT